MLNIQTPYLNSFTNKYLSSYVVNCFFFFFFSPLIMFCSHVYIRMKFTKIYAVKVLL